MWTASRRSLSRARRSPKTSSVWWTITWLPPMRVTARRAHGSPHRRRRVRAATAEQTATPFPSGQLTKSLTAVGAAAKKLHEEENSGHPRDELYPAGRGEILGFPR